MSLSTSKGSRAARLENPLPLWAPLAAPSAAFRPTDGASSRTPSLGAQVRCPTRALTVARRDALDRKHRTGALPRLLESTQARPHYLLGQAKHVRLRDQQHQSAMKLLVARWS
eukprot:XP_001708660.1 Hypothetical protein GL50803_98230 [Giardia lamblia ATCC 50803]